MSNGIRKIFAEVPRTYELVNHVLTFGMDFYWRRRAAAIAASEAAAIAASEAAASAAAAAAAPREVGSAAGGRTARWLDVCSGTGEMAENLARLAPSDVRIFAADFSLPMLGVARRKRRLAGALFVAADATRLPFRDGTFDIVTISFAARNLNVDRPSLVAAFAEFRRVLRPGGRFVNLETSQPPSRAARWIFHRHARYGVKWLGAAISGSRPGYAYLSRTLQSFYTADELSAIMLEAGFGGAGHRALARRVAAVHTAVR